MAGKRPPNAARSARQRPITCPTGSSLQSPRLSGRVVMPATTPYRWAHSASSRRGTAASPAGTSARDGTGAACSAPASCAPDLSAPLNLRPQRSQPVVDVLVAPLDLPDVLDHRIALRRERGQQHRHADRKSTRLNSSHGYISYAVFCLKKKNVITVSYVFVSTAPRT